MMLRQKKCSFVIINGRRYQWYRCRSCSLNNECSKQKEDPDINGCFIPIGISPEEEKEQRGEK